MDEFLSSAAINPNLVGPTLPPVPPFTLPTVLTISINSTYLSIPTGPTGSTGPPFLSMFFLSSNPS
ncbi:exosporium leader peptide-containing protein [Bacillus anthracis]|uniref:exosporium leader peptide-containing protein n=1 Tax=Bacillus anthracis TaxID=1392 RepID=UPI00396F6995